VTVSFTTTRHNVAVAGQVNNACLHDGLGEDRLDRLGAAPRKGRWQAQHPVAGCSP
jgi:hypothetical protein